MKKIILLIALLGVFTITLMAADFERDSEDAFDYMKENNIEYEVMLDKAVKELPEDAKFLTVENVRDFIENTEVEIYTTRTFYTLQNYVYAGFSSRPCHKVRMTGGTSLTGGDGYLYKWERNTSNSQSSTEWSSITSSVSFPGGSGWTHVSYCDETNLLATQHSNDDSEYTACGRCNAGDVYSVQFSVRPYTIVMMQNYIPGIGWVSYPVKLYLDWYSTLSKGTPSGDPVWDLCDTNLSNFCD